MRKVNFKRTQGNRISGRKMEEDKNKIRNDCKFS
jgi:hypothetical protein